MLNNTYETIYKEQFPFWNSLSDSDKEYLCKSSTTKVFKKGEHIYDGNNSGGVVFLLNGCIRVYMISEDGKELTLLRIHDEELCILSASFVTKPFSFDILVDTEIDCECYYIPTETFEYINKKYTDARIYALESTLECMADIMWLMEQILFMSMDKRLAIFLLDEINRCDADTVMLTHSLIAKYMGSAREVVSRMLKYFESENTVQFSRRGVRVIDKDRLREMTK